MKYLKYVFLLTLLSCSAISSQSLPDSLIYYDVTYKQKKPEFTSQVKIDTVAIGDTIKISWNPVRSLYGGSVLPNWDKTGNWSKIGNFSDHEFQPKLPISNRVMFSSEIKFSQSGYYTFRVWSWRFVPTNSGQKWFHSPQPSEEVGIYVSLPNDTAQPEIPVMLPIIIRRKQ